MQPPPLDACMGAQIDGADLGAPMSGAAFDEIRGARHTDPVRVFRAQRLDASASLAFARRLAVSEPHVLGPFPHPDPPEILILSNMRKEGATTGLADGGTYWHSDYSYLEVPARATMQCSNAARRSTHAVADHDQGRGKAVTVRRHEGVKA